MRMWHSKSDLTTSIKPTPNVPKSEVKSNTSVNSASSLLESEGYNDADDFYVFLYDEEDRSNTQTVLRKGHNSRGY